MADPRLARLWAAVERMRAAARGGREIFGAAVEEYDELLSAIDATREYPLAEVCSGSGLERSMVRRLRAEARARWPSGS
jgi:hypothetical protein